MCPSCHVYDGLPVRSCSTTLNMHKLDNVAHHTEHNALSPKWWNAWNTDSIGAVKIQQELKYRMTHGEILELVGLK